jgi:hypothetical protein
VACCGVDYGSSGALNYGVNDSYWFDDGYGDYIRNFLWALGALPELAPKGQNHLLRSSSVVQQVRYSPHGITYGTFDRDATEVLRLHFLPARVTAGGAPIGKRPNLRQQGYTVDALSGGDFVVRVRHVDSNEIAISGE